MLVLQGCIGTETALYIYKYSNENIRSITKVPMEHSLGTHKLFVTQGQRQGLPRAECPQVQFSACLIHSPLTELR